MSRPCRGAGGHHRSGARSELAIAASADGITAHLGRIAVIRDDDVAQLKARSTSRSISKMAATAEMVAIAIKTLPYAACIVPERREERTTEGWP